MSDYLNSIVTRSLGVADVVQPRLPQLFEHPNQYHAEPDSALEISLEQNAEIPADERLANRPTPASTSASVSKFEPSIAQTITPRVETPTSDPAATVRTLEPIHEESIDPDANAQRLATKSETQLVPRSAQSRRNTSAERRESFDRPLPQPTAPTVSANALNKAPELATTVRPALPSAPLPSPSSNAHLEQPSPPIRITIGRVDVRAIMPPGPAARPAPARPRPALSLESYLKEREQGKR